MSSLRALYHSRLLTTYSQVINYANNTSRAEDVLKELNNIPSTVSSQPSPRFHAIRADIGNRDAITTLIQETITTMGRLDVVISNAGYTRLTNFMNFDEQHFDEDWDKCFLYNVKAHMWLAYAAREHLDKTEGAFITTASIAGVKPSGSSLPYAVTKAASIHLTKCLANICAPRIRFNSVSPGLMLTEWGYKFSEQKREAHKNNTKLKRLPEVDDVAEQVRTLALSKSMTGQNIIIDCGLTS
ncbi:NAD(P)-binding protein [Aureobasidium pullulans]|nr:NAD(P)-binding protein [Aureobasidium pullulans]